MYKELQLLDNLTINFNSGGIHLVNIVLAFVMFGVALEIKFSDFKNIFLNPKNLLVGLFSQIIILPAVTFLLVMLGYRVLPPSVAIGMILVAACPGGNMSNFMTSLAKGNVALSVGLTSINTIFAVITTPFNFEFWGKLYVNFLSKHSSGFIRPLEISTSNMLFTLFILLIVPLFLGMLFAHYFPKLKDKLVGPLKKVSLLAFFIILAAALANNLQNFLNNLGYIFIVVFFHNLAAILSGYGIARLFKLQRKSRQTVAIETGIQNSGLGLALLFNPKIFPAGSVTGGMLFVTAWWGIWHIISGLFVSFLFRRVNNRKAAQEAN